MVKSASSSSMRGAICSRQQHDFPVSGFRRARPGVRRVSWPPRAPRGRALPPSRRSCHARRRRISFFCCVFASFFLCPRGLETIKIARGTPRGTRQPTPPVTASNPCRCRSCSWWRCRLGLRYRNSNTHCSPRAPFVAIVGQSRPWRPGRDSRVCACLPACVRLMARRVFGQVSVSMAAQQTAQLLAPPRERLGDFRLERSGEPHF